MTQNGGPPAPSPSGGTADPTGAPTAQWPDPLAYGQRAFQQWYELHAAHVEEEDELFELLTWWDKVLAAFQECNKQRRADLTQDWKDEGRTWPAVATRAKLSVRRTRELAAMARPYHLRGSRSQDGDESAQGPQPEAAEVTQP